MLISGGFLVLAGMILLFAIVISKKEDINNYPQIILAGEKIIYLNQNEPYVEPGYTAKDIVDGDLTNKVQVKNDVDSKKAGTYEISYEVKNNKGLSSQEKRFVVVQKRKIPGYLDKYDSISNERLEWGLSTNTRHMRTTGTSSEADLKKYDAYYIGKDEKIIYLTFDEGSNDTYVKEILEVLKKNDVKATFFFCKGYMMKNQELIKAIADAGMSVGNHTANHKDMTTLASKEKYDEYVEQILANEEAYLKITGRAMDKVYREPMGVYSYRSLQIVKDLGYKSYFWSSSYYDFAEDVSKEKALQMMMTRYHNGAIYLLHPKNKGNYLALEDFILNMKQLGYSFGLVKDI